MKPLIRAAILILGAAAATASYASTDYVHEINSVRDRQRAYVETMNAKYVAIKRFDYRWKRVGQLVSTLKAALDTPTPDTANTLTRLTAIQAKLQSAKTLLLMAEAPLDAEFASIENVLAENGFDASTDLYQAHQQKKREVLTALKSLKDRITAESASAEQGLQQWLELSRQEALQAGIADRRTILTTIEFQSKIAEWSSSFSNIRIRFFSALQFGRIDQARRMLDGTIWLRNAVVLYFAGKPRLPDQEEQYRILLQKIDDQIAAQTTALSRQMLSAPQRPSFGLLQKSRSRDQDREPDFEKDTRSTDDWDIPKNERESNSCRERVFEYGGQRYSSYEGNRSEPKRFQEAVESDGNAGIAVELADRGTVIDKENVERGISLLGRFNGEIGKWTHDRMVSSGRYEKLETSLRSDTHETLAQETEHIRGMIERARERTRDDDHREELSVLSQEVARFQAIQQHYQPFVGNAIAEALASADGAQQFWSGLTRFTLPPPPIQAPYDPQASARMREELLRTGLQAMELAIGILPGYGDAYDIANFLYALAVDQTLIGTPMSGINEKLLLGAAAVMPFVSGGMVTTGRHAVETLTTLSKQPLRLTAHSSDYLARLLKAFPETTPADAQRLTALYEALDSRTAQVVPSTYEGTITRAAKPFGGRSVTEMLAGLFELHPGNISANHRYSMPGQGAVYTSIGENALETIAKELETTTLEGFVIGSKQVKLQRVLNLEDPAVLQTLGLTRADLTIEKGSAMYEITHQLGDLAKRHGFDAIIAPSAKTETGRNLIILAH